MIRSTLGGLALFLASATAAAETLDINLSDETIRGAFFGPLPTLRAHYSLGAMTGKENDSRFTQAHGALLVTGDAGARQANVTAGLGGRLAVLDVRDLGPALERVHGGALGLGGMIEARLPAFNRIGAFAYAYWGPKAASFGEFEEYLEYALSVDYQVIREASAYIGYRQLKVEIQPGGVFPGGEFTVDNGFHLGLRLNF